MKALATISPWEDLKVTVEESACSSKRDAESQMRITRNLTSFQEKTSMSQEVDALMKSSLVEIKRK